MNPLQAPPLAENKVGRRVGHYELVERIVAGGMGEVYRARDLALGRGAALKLLPPSFDPDLRVRLIHEAEASAKLQHPAIATFYEAGDADGETFIAMEFVRGQTLRERLRHGAIPPERVLAITCALLEALAHAHAAGLLHRDIKPENIVVSGDDAAKLLDFGIAAPLASSDGAVTWRPESADLTVTTDGGLVGTPGYLAPEQLAGDPLDAPCRSQVRSIRANASVTASSKRTSATCGPGCSSSALARVRSRMRVCCSNARSRSMNGMRTLWQRWPRPTRSAPSPRRALPISKRPSPSPNARSRSSLNTSKGSSGRAMRSVV